MTATKQGAVSWADRQPFVVVPALRSLKSILAVARKRGAVWVVLRRAVYRQELLLFYAYRTSELEDRADELPSRLEMTAFDALDLHETGQSATSSGAARPREARVDTTASPTASRIVHLDVEERPVAVGQIAAPAEAPLPARRGGGSAGQRAKPPVTRTARPPAPPTPGRRELEAVLSAQGPSEVQVGKDAVIDVKVALAGTAAPLRHATKASISPEEKIVAILTVQGDALEPLEPRLVRLDVPAADRPSTTAFGVRALREGRARVAVIFRQGGTELGTVAFAVQVVTTAPAEAAASGTSVAAAPRDPADDDVVLLIIDEDRSSGGWGYLYRLVAPPLGWDYLEFSSPPLKDRGKGVSRTASGYVNSIYDRMDGAASRGGAGLARELRAVGTDLTRQLFPTDLLRLLWDHREKLQTVHVRSWEPYIPWEVARLRHPDTDARDERFLAEYNLVRSLNGLSRRPGLRLQTWRYLAASYPNGLEEALDGDVAIFTETLQARRIAATPIPADLDTLFDALNEPDFDVLHICCHGRAEHGKIEQSELIIGDRMGRGGAPEPITIDPVTVREEARLATRGPLVFLNACESGRMGASLTAWGGWPRTFWDAGAAAFVGTAWPVEDKAAKAFCEIFYGSLLDGKTLAQAAGAARAASKPLDDASWLAYKVYGYPGARRP